MPDTFTEDLNLVKPEIGGSIDTWGNKTNGNWDKLDAFAVQMQAALEAYQDQFVGSLAMFPVEAVPTGWLAADGSEYEESEHPKLFARIGRTFGGTEPGVETPGTFKVPDYRSEWLRCSDFGRGVSGQVSRGLNDYQGSQNLAHNHGGNTSDEGAHIHSASSASAGQHSHTGTTNTTGAHTHNAGQYTVDNHLQDGGWDTRDSRPWMARSSMSAAGNHSHSLNVNSAGAHTHAVTVAEAGSHEHAIAYDGGDEVRVRGYHALMCIKT